MKNTKTEYHAPEHDWRYEEAANRAEDRETIDQEMQRLWEGEHDPMHWETPPRT